MGYNICARGVQHLRTRGTTSAHAHFAGGTTSAQPDLGFCLSGSFWGVFGLVEGYNICAPRQGVQHLRSLTCGFVFQGSNICARKGPQDANPRGLVVGEGLWVELAAFGGSSRDRRLPRLDREPVRTKLHASARPLRQNLIKGLAEEPLEVFAPIYRIGNS